MEEAKITLQNNALGKQMKCLYDLHFPFPSTETQITSNPINFVNMTNNTITTTNNSTTLTAQGNVSLVNVGNNTNAIQLTNGGSVTLPTDPCVQRPGQCASGFTLTVELNLLNISDDKVFIATNTGGKQNSQGQSISLTFLLSLERLCRFRHIESFGGSIVIYHARFNFDSLKSFIKVVLLKKFQQKACMLDKIK